LIQADEWQNGAMTGGDNPSSGGLFAPSSVMWKISREHILIAGGVSAAILQIAHPAVAHGVKNHSSFRQKPLLRLRNTLDAVYSVAFGSREEVEKTRAHIARLHTPVHGVFPENRSYSAFDPDAQWWVLSTLIHNSVFVYERWVSPLTDMEKEEFLREYRTFGEVFGLDPAHGAKSWADFQKYYEEMIHGDLLGSDPVCVELAQAIACPPHPVWRGKAVKPLHFLVAEFIPSPLRERLGFPSDRQTVRALKTADRIIPKILPLLPDGLRFCRQYCRAAEKAASL